MIDQQYIHIVNALSFEIVVVFQLSTNRDEQLFFFLHQHYVLQCFPLCLKACVAKKLVHVLGYSHFFFFFF